MWIVLQEKNERKEHRHTQIHKMSRQTHSNRHTDLKELNYIIHSMHFSSFFFVFVYIIFIQNFEQIIIIQFNMMYQNRCCIAIRNL